ncbi:MAG: YkgJ family cysteine cluster protein [Deltaproteobacteria bacterium]|nr:YkgJ family cysteine cluster protein [Deltaproteobacteria bacterium]
MEIENQNKPGSAAFRNSCIRCGTCCEKGGPCLHLEDRQLVDEGLIHTRCLYTIRRGEMVHDNVRNVVMPSPEEMIKIKGMESSWQCTFFNAAESACGIYRHRPMECRVLKCWDPSGIEAVYDRDRLKRQDLLADIAGLWDLVQEHERQCSYPKLKLILNDMDRNRDTGFQRTAVASTVTMVRYDREVRDLVVSKGGVEPGMTDFLFGRPLSKTIEVFGYKVREKDGKGALVRI